MTKFLRLMKNEWRKELAKRATWVMLILLCVVTVVAAALGSIEIEAGLFLDDMSLEEFCREEIAWYEEELASGKADADSLEYYRTELEVCRIMLEAGMEYGDWRYELDLARLAAGEKLAGDEDAYREWMDVITSNEPAKYFSLMKRYYEGIYQYDPERLEIYTSAMDFCIAGEVIPSYTGDWRYPLIESLIQNRETVLTQLRLRESGGAWSESVLEKAQNLAAVAQYRLEHDVVLNPADSFSNYDMFSLYVYDDSLSYVEVTSSFWDVAASSVGVLVLVSVFGIVLAGTTVSSEFSSGTVKFLLISPVKRRKILFSKYATVLLMMLGMTALVGVLSLGMAAVFGAKDAFLPAVFAAQGKVYTLSPYLLMLREYGYELVSIVVMMTLAFAISTLTRRSAMAIGVTVLFGSVGSSISTLLQFVGVDAGRYLLFSNLEWKAILAGSPTYPHQSIWLALTVVVLHMAVFLLVAHDAFVRREI